MKNLIKKQEKEFDKKFLNFRKDSESVNFKDRNEDTLAFELKAFISKIRKETAEEVIKKMNELPRVRITHKDGSESMVVLEHSIENVRNIIKLLNL